MIEFNVGGILLDVPSGTRLQFVKKNILFAFDSIECERTTSFRLPKTPTNLRAFDFSNDFHRQGTAMRIRVDAQLRIGVVVKNGYLYVQTYSHKSQEFDCIFVTGELLGLKQLKELGKANEIPYEYNDNVSYNVLTSPTILLQNPNFRVMRSYADDDINRPSYNLGHILDWLVSNTDITFSELPNQLDVLITEPNQLQPTIFSITQQVVDSSQPTPDISEDYYNTIAASANVYAVFDNIGYDEYNGEPTVILGVQRYYRPRFLRAKMDVKITFPADFPNVFMYGMRDTYGGMVFYGDYSFSVVDYQMTISGEPLAGRTISLKKDDAFIFVDSDDFQMVRGSAGGGLPSLGFYPLISQTNFDGMTVEADGELKTGDIIYLRDNMPSLTAVDILKIYAYINGKVLWYDSENERVTFEDLIVSDYPVYTLKNAINVTSVKRTFGDYAQKNILRYESPEFMRSSDVIEEQYTIDNVNIEQEKELYRIPFSEGRRYRETRALQIRATDNDTIAYPNLLSGRLFRTELVKNNVLQAILTNSTTIDVQCDMSLFEFDSIRDKMRIFYDNAYWVWLNISWNNGVADITLAKV